MTTTTRARMDPDAGIGDGGPAPAMAATITRAYVRVSNSDIKPENQESELREWAAREGHPVEHVYTDTVSGAKGDRAALKQALADAERREFDVLLVWALDRLSREGISKMLGHLERFKACGVRVRSLREPWLDSEGPMGELLTAIFAWCAKQERDRLRERVVTGLRRAQKNGTRSGKPIGRPARAVDLQEVMRRRARGDSWRAVSRALHTPMRTIWRRANATNGVNGNG